MADERPTVCILTAGQGSRMGVPYPFNKALLPIGGKAVLSRIIEKFPPHSRYIIALGYCAQQVRDYVQAAHPTREFTFVDIIHAAGPGSGPGRSLFECAPYLTQPFFLVASDTLWTDELPMSSAHSWVGVAGTPAPDSQNYCNVCEDDGLVTGFIEKQNAEHLRPFVGLAYVHAPEKFFAALEVAPAKGETQISQGLAALIADGLRTQVIAWTDVGTREKYQAAARQAQIGTFDFGKEEEFIYFVGDRVVKFFNDRQAVANRVERARIHADLFPAVEFAGGQFYTYRYRVGRTLYAEFSAHRVQALLQWLNQHLWRLQTPSADFFAGCRRFYWQKTQERIAQWECKYPDFIEPMQINGQTVPTLRMLLARMPWSQIFYGGYPSRFHGDLQPDNILCIADEGEFVLLDWRQDFAGTLQEGDIYYDFAKLRCGLYLNYHGIKQGLWSYGETPSGCHFSLPAVTEQARALAVLDAFVHERGFDVQRVRLLMGLAFANMAPLHQAPYDKLLWNVARDVLTAELGVSADVTERGVFPEVLERIRGGR